MNITNEEKYSNCGSHLTSVPSICVNIKFMDIDPTDICSVSTPEGFRPLVLNSFLYTFIKSQQEHHT